MNKTENLISREAMFPSEDFTIWYEQFQHLGFINGLHIPGMSLFSAVALVGLGKASSRLWLHEEKGTGFGSQEVCWKM